MIYSLLALLAATLHDHRVGTLVVAGLETLGELAPRRAWMPATGRTTLTTTHRVIDGVHRDAAVVRTLAHPTNAARLAERDVRVIDVGHLADRGLAVLMDHADFARGHTNLRVVAVLRHENRADTGRTDELSALALAHLEVVDRRPERDVTKRHRVAGLDVRVAARGDLVADGEAVRRE